MLASLLAAVIWRTLLHDGLHLLAVLAAVIARFAKIFLIRLTCGLLRLLCLEAFLDELQVEISDLFEQLNVLERQLKQCPVERDLSLLELQEDQIISRAPLVPIY